MRGRQAPSASCWIFVSSAMPDPARSSSASRSSSSERRAFGRPLDLDEVSRPGHHDVEIDVRARVLLVAQVQSSLAVHDADGHGGHAVGEDVVGNDAALGQASQRERERDVSARDGRGARPGVGLQARRSRP